MTINLRSLYRLLTVILGLSVLNIGLSQHVWAEGRPLCAMLFQSTSATNSSPILREPSEREGFIIEDYLRSRNQLHEPLKSMSSERKSALRLQIETYFTQLLETHSKALAHFQTTLLQEKLKAQPQGQTMTLNGKTYDILAKLGSGGEGTAFLASLNGQQVVIKTHLFSQNVYRQYPAYVHMHRLRLSVQVLDKTEEAFVLEYHQGLVRSDFVDYCQRQGLSDDLVWAFDYFHAQFMDYFALAVDSEFKKFLSHPDSLYLNLRGDNVLFNPQTRRSIIIDPS